MQRRCFIVRLVNGQERVIILKEMATLHCAVLEVESILSDRHILLGELSRHIVLTLILLCFHVIHDLFMPHDSSNADFTV